MSLLSAPVGATIVIGYVLVSSAAWFVWAQMRVRRVQGWDARPRPRRAADRYMLLRPPYVDVYEALLPTLVVLEGIILFGVPLILVVVGLSNLWGLFSRPLDYAVGAGIVLIISVMFLGGCFWGVNLYIRTFIHLLRRNPLPNFASTVTSDNCSDVSVTGEAVEWSDTSNRY